MRRNSTSRSSPHLAETEALLGQSRLATEGGVRYVRARRALASDRGQTMTEYIVALAFAATGLLVFSKAFQIAIARYLAPIYFTIGLPIP